MSKLKLFFRAYLGFFLGLPAIVICIAGSDATDGLYRGAMSLVSDVSPYWFEAFLYNFLDAFMSLMLYFGVFFFLGGLIGDHDPRIGVGVACVVSLLILVAFALDNAATGHGPDFFIAGALGTFLGGLLPYLLGYSIRRLYVLSAAAPQ